MTELPLHPAIVHIPIGIALALPAVAGAALAGIWLKKLEPKTWYLILLLQLILLAGGGLSMNTGEDEEHKVEAVVSEDHIESHEETAKLFMLISALGTIGSLGAIVAIRSNEKTGRYIMAGTTAVLVAAAGMALATGHEGGELVYRHGAAGAYTAPASAPAGQPRGERDD